MSSICDDPDNYAKKLRDFKYLQQAAHKRKAYGPPLEAFTIMDEAFGANMWRIQSRTSLLDIRHSGCL
jgi:hypothetical protein